MVSTPEKPAAAPLSARAGVGAAFNPVELRLPASWTVSEATFLDLCRRNELLQFETTEDGALIIMVGEGWDTSQIGMRLGSQLLAWSDNMGGGGVGGASGAVRISETIMTIPDVCWVSDSRARQQPDDYDGVLLPVCPEFVIEIRSESDSLDTQRAKMERWIRYGVLLGWLVDPQEPSVWIFRPEQEPHQVPRPEELTGEDVCDGLVVNFSRIWESNE